MPNLPESIRAKWEKLNWYTPSKGNLSDESIIENIFKNWNYHDLKTIFEATNKDYLRQIYLARVRKPNPNFKFKYFLDIVFDIKDNDIPE